MQFQNKDNIYPEYNRVPGENAPSLDYNKLKNRPIRYYALSLNQTGGGAAISGDLDFFDIFTGQMGDIEQEYTNIKLVDNNFGNTKITKLSTIGELPILVKKGTVIQYSVSRQYIEYKLYQSQKFVILSQIESKTHKNITCVAKQDAVLDFFIQNNGTLDRPLRASLFIIIL